MTVPTLIYPREDVANELEALTDMGRAVALIGPPGTGKTQLGKRLAQRLGVPAYVFASSNGALDTDVTLTFLPRADGTWGPVPKAYAHAAGFGPRYGFDSKPGVLVLDDIHRAGQGMEDAMMTACDGRFTEWLDPVSGEMLTPDDAYRCILTSNAPDAESLDPAIRSRVCAVVPVLTPSKAMLDILHPDVRDLCATDYDNNPKPAVEYRAWQSVSYFWPKLGLAKACLIAMGSPDRAKRMLVALASYEVDDAITVVNQLIREGDVEVRNLMAQAA